MTTPIYGIDVTVDDVVIARSLRLRLDVDPFAAKMTPRQLQTLATTLHNIAVARAYYIRAMGELTGALMEAEAALMAVEITELPIPVKTAIRDSSTLAWEAERTRSGHRNAALATRHLSRAVQMYADAQTTEKAENVNG